MVIKNTTPNDMKIDKNDEFSMQLTDIDKQVRQLFIEILTDIYEFIKNGKNDDTMKTNNMDHKFKWTVKDFTYNDDGVHTNGIITTEMTKEDNPGAYWYKLHTNVTRYCLKSPRVLDLEKLISDNYQLPENQTGVSLQRFIQSALTNEWTDIDIKETVDDVLKYFKGEKFTCYAIVELIGIILQEQSIDLGCDITIGRTSQKDIDKNFPTYPADCDYSKQYPTAIMKISMQAKTPKELKDRIKRIIFILRLFSVGSIRDVRFKIYSGMTDPWFGGGGMNIETLDNSRQPHTYLVRQSDKECLKKFFCYIDYNLKKISNSSSKKDKSIIIVYNRYIDSLKNNSLDRKIADAVMGLEGIFLEDDGELSLRLSLRVASLMKFLGKDQLNVRDMVKEAYNIRSKFVHGNCIESKDVKKLEKYGGPDTFIEELLEILRIALVVSITMDIPKTNFIQILDKSLLEYNQEEGNMVVSNAQNILCINKK